LGARNRLGGSTDADDGCADGATDEAVESLVVLSRFLFPLIDGATVGLCFDGFLSTQMIREHAVLIGFEKLD
jgi:hypothetical protein